MDYQNTLDKYTIYVYSGVVGVVIIAIMCVLNIGADNFLVVHEEIKKYTSRMIPSEFSMIYMEFVRLSLYGVVTEVYKLFVRYDEDIKTLQREFDSIGSKNQSIKIFYNKLIDEFDQYGKNEQKNVKNFMKFVIKLTKYTKAINDGGLSTDTIQVYSKDIQNVCDELLLLVKDYDTAKLQLEEKLTNAILLIMNGCYNTTTNAIFLHGSPGVGKTYFVEKLASITGAKIYKYSPNTDYNFRPSPSEILESQLDSYPVFVKIAANNADPKIPIILFIDEFDKGIIKSNPDPYADQNTDIQLCDMLELLGDSVCKKKYIEEFDITLEIPKNLIVICSSNKSLAEISKAHPNYNPLISRFDEVHIPDINKDIKYKLSLKHMESIHQNIDSLDDKFIRKLIDMTDYAGVRELFSLINTYVQYLNSYNVLKNYKNLCDKNTYIEQYLEDLTNVIDAAKCGDGDSDNSDNSDSDSDNSESDGDSDNGDGDGDGMIMATTIKKC